MNRDTEGQDARQLARDHDSSDVGHLADRPVSAADSLGPGDPVADWAQTRRALGWLVVAGVALVVNVIVAEILGTLAGAGEISFTTMDWFSLAAIAASLPLLVGTWRLARIGSSAARVARVALIVALVTRAALLVMGLVHTRIEVFFNPSIKVELEAFFTVKSVVGWIRFVTEILTFVALTVALRRIAVAVDRSAPRRFATIYFAFIAIHVASMLVWLFPVWDGYGYDLIFALTLASTGVELVLFSGGFVLLTAWLRASLPKETALTRTFE